jgi:single-stranded-DNA-specific exonuclease
MADGGLRLEESRFLGVARSLTGRPWALRAADPAFIRALRQRYDLEEPVARVLAARADDLEDAGRHLHPTLRDLFPDPSSFLGMDAAVELILEAVRARRRLVVFADYDVDGATSAALLVRWCRAFGHEALIYVPDRVREGYGPSVQAFERLKAEGADLVVTLDCGAAAEDALAHAVTIDLKVVVIDHHMMRPGAAPPCAALVNPNQGGCASGQGDLAAAGVVFVLLAALNRRARAQGLCPAAGEPDLRRWLDLAALGAVCDVTRLRGFNRALVAQGLKVMSLWDNPGLKALLHAAKAEGAQASAYHAGFILGPRINAGGRIGRADLGARLLSTDDPDEAREIALALDALNGERRDIERAAFEEAVAQVERASNRPHDGPLVLTAAEGWHPGVVGIIAGRLRERYRRPAVVIGIDPATGLGKGSGRSQPGVNLGRAVHAAFEAGLLLAGGGHAMAAGLTVRRELLPELEAFLSEALREESAQAAIEDVLEVDALAAPGPEGRRLLDAFRRLEPFGPGAPEPVVAFANLLIERPQALKGGHVRCGLKGPDGGRIRAVAWRAEDTPLGRRLLAGGGVVHAAGRLKLDAWNGKETLELEIFDLADPRQIENIGR